MMLMDKLSTKTKDFDANSFVLPQESTLEHFLQAIALCNNVYLSSNLKGGKVFDASSPDEIAMVEFIEKIGMSFDKKTDKEIQLRSEFSTKKFSVLIDFPFDSARKRMGAIL